VLGRELFVILSIGGKNWAIEAGFRFVKFSSAVESDDDYSDGKG
jgi:hypothetical protein